MPGDFDNSMFDISKSWSNGLEAEFWKSNSGLGAGGSGGSSWVNSYLGYSNAAFENGYESSTSQFDHEVNKQAGSPGYNGSISIQTGIDLLTYNQCGLINDFINCQFKLLSVRSANALTALLGKTIDLNSIKLLFPVRVEKLKDLKNVGNKSVFELDTFLQRL